MVELDPNAKIELVRQEIGYVKSLLTNHLTHMNKQLENHVRNDRWAFGLLGTILIGIFGMLTVVLSKLS